MIWNAEKVLNAVPMDVDMSVCLQFQVYIVLFICVLPFTTRQKCADDRSTYLQKMSKNLKLLNFMTIFEITMEIAFKKVQTCLVLV